MVDLHRHDEASLFDGFGKSNELAKLALQLGHTSFSTSNHGNVANWVQHYFDCKEIGIKPILGVEAYFKPSAKMNGRGYHLCLFAKNKIGYKNINRMLLKGEKNRYYNSIITFEDLAECSDGVICTTACIASYTSQMIKKGKNHLAIKALKKMQNIFGEDLYIEIQPYKIDDENTQQKVDWQLIKLSKELKIKCVLTSDSHYGAKDDFDSYLKMHEIAGHSSIDITKTYGERYMPTEKEIKNRFIKMYSKKMGENSAKEFADNCIKNLEEIENKVDGNMLDDFKPILPKYCDNSKQEIYNLVMQGLKDRGKYNKKYIDRCNFELDVIDTLEYNDYFLMVADYVNWAKEKGIAVGAGRGSCCNSLVCYALKITEVDSLLFDLTFSRFLRKDKKKMPDIDLDFQTDRRDEVLHYLLNKYRGHAAQVSNYGLYKIDNLINDLAKKCGLPTDKTVEKETVKENELKIKEIKSFIKQFSNEEIIDFDSMKQTAKYKQYNAEYDNILKHFSKLYKKIRFFGVHAAGVAITGDNILCRAAVKKDSKSNKLFTYYDLNDLDKISITKFDILGLNTMQEIQELRNQTGVKCDYDKIVNDKKLIRNFRNGNTIGVFQFESLAAREMLAGINCDCFNDLVAVNAMNRPGPLSLKMPEQYAENKRNIDVAKNTLYYRYTKESYGTIIYQEQIQAIAVNIGKLSWDEADKIMKMMKGGAMSKAMKENEELVSGMKKKFIHGAKENGMNKQEAAELFDKMITYSFNKGHATGYALIAMEEMFYKVYYPTQFWAYKLKMTTDPDKLNQYKSQAVKDGCVIFTSHVNGTAEISMKKVDGDDVIQDGLISIKGVGLKAAKVIEKYSPYIDYPDFEEKMSELPKEEKRAVTSKIIQLLKNAGAFEFYENKYYNAVLDYNRFLYARELNFR